MEKNYNETITVELTCKSSKENNTKCHEINTFGNNSFTGFFY